MTSLAPLLTLWLMTLCCVVTPSTSQSRDQCLNGPRPMVNQEALQDMDQENGIFFDERFFDNKVYELKNYTTEFETKESCGKHARTAFRGGRSLKRGVTVLACPSTPEVQPGFKWLYRRCCKTTMRMVKPLTVTNLITGQVYNVVHFGSSTQLLHLGLCASPNAICNGGSCVQAFRIQYVLIEDNTGSRFFVPVVVPNHCKCVYL